MAQRAYATAFLGLTASIATLLGVRGAAAEVYQPSDTAMTQPMPRPTPDSENNIARGRGFPEDALTLQGLFKYRNEELDPVADARIAPGVFSPLCGFSGQIVMHGGGCELALGWYNVDQPNEIYELVPPDYTAELQCTMNDFCPMATMETTQVENWTETPWVEKIYPAANIRNDPRYLGGLVGFALVGKPGSQCTQTKYSQAELNSPCTSCSPPAPWVTTLIYQSTATPDAFYIAFEDRPMSGDNWSTNNDGDFNDVVFFISGLSCKGGGQPCDTGKQGACAVGRTDCGEGDDVICRETTQGTAERCDNVDNDCNGLVDDGELCPAGRVCDKGACVSSCGSGEFKCNAGLACDDGFCVDPACKDVECDPGQACRGGECVEPCQGVTCPGEQVCQLGRCVDLCANVQCEDGRVCEGGLCVASCDCRTCPEGKACAADGRCLETGCEDVQCDAGQVCRAGSCVDACEGVVCPGGAACNNGSCGDPVPMEPEPGSDGGISFGDGGVVLNPDGPSGGPMPGSDGGVVNPGQDPGSAAEASCACRAGTRTGAGGWLAVPAGLASALLLRRLRQRRRGGRRA